MSRVLFVAVGQSNWQGAGRHEGGGVAPRVRSAVTGEADPFPGCNNINQGASCFPTLIDIAARRGVRLDVLNYAIGGASVFHYCGRVGAAVTGGSASLPAQQGYMDPVGLSGGTETSVEGGSGFDPFGLLARTRAAIAARLAAVAYDDVVTYWQNAESDVGSSAATYASGLQSVASYLLASGARKHFIGLSSKPASSVAASMDTLWTGVQQAVAAVPGCYLGHSMWAHYGGNPPLYAESDGTTYVHLTVRGQQVQAWRVSEALAAAGVI